MPITPEQPFTSPQEEIEWLKQQLENKKEAYRQKNETKEDNEISKEVLREASEIPETEIHEAYKLDDEKVQAHSHALAEEPHHKQMDELMNIARGAGILNAVRIARSLGPHLLDDFHDRIIADGLFGQK